MSQLSRQRDPKKSMAKLHCSCKISEITGLPATGKYLQESSKKVVAFTTPLVCKKSDWWETANWTLNAIVWILLLQNWFHTAMVKTHVTTASLRKATIDPHISNTLPELPRFISSCELVRKSTASRCEERPATAISHRNLWQFKARIHSESSWIKCAD